MPERLWRIADVCRHYGIARRTFYQWRAHHDFPDPEPGHKQPRYNARAVQAWRKANPRYESLRTSSGHAGEVVGRHRKGMTPPEIARETGLSAPTIRRVLRRKGEIA